MTLYESDLSGLAASAAQTALVDCLLAELHSWGGVQLGSHQRSAVLAAVREDMRSHGIHSIEEYIRWLACHEDERHRLLAGLSNKETSFFRCPQQFNLLRERVLPELLARRRDTHSLHIWSAGCSYGAEAYSLAMLIHELLTSGLPAEERALWSVSIWATDLDPAAIATARGGRYASDQLRGLPMPLRQRYLVPQGREHVFVKPIRQMITFDVLNLVDPEAWSRVPLMDLILCRNVLIYLDRQTTRDLVGRFGRSVAEDGYLMLGHAETVWDMGDLVKPVEMDGVFVYQRPRPKDRPPEQSALPKKPAVAPHRGLFTHIREKWQESHETPPPAQPQRESVQSSAQEAEACYLAAHALANQGRLAEAAAQCDRAIVLNVLHAGAYLLGGTIALSRNNLAGAELAFQRLAYLHPDDPLAHYHLAETYRRQARPIRAAAGYRKALKLLETLPSGMSLGETNVGLLRLACQRALAGAPQPNNPPDRDLTAPHL